MFVVGSAQALWHCVLVWPYGERCRWCATLCLVLGGGRTLLCGQARRGAVRKC